MAAERPKVDTRTVSDAIREYCGKQNRNGSAMTGFTVNEIQIADNDLGRLDVVAWWPKSSTTWIEGFEVKTSRSDFLADVTKGKYRRYLDYCDGFWFAVAEGVARAAELPDEIGFMVVRPDGSWRVHRKPKPTKQRINGRQMDRIATRLTEIAKRRLEREDELERTAVIMRRMCELSESRDPAYSRYWGHWLAAGVRKRIHEGEEAAAVASAIIENARREADLIVEDARRTAERVNVDERLGAWGDALTLANAAADLLSGRRVFVPGVESVIERMVEARESHE